jgi:hypothetical protein
VTADAKSKVYGASVPALTYTLTGFVNGDTAGVVSGAAILSTKATTASGAGTYPITVAAGTPSAANYDFSGLVNGTLTVTKAHLTVTADTKPKRYGDPLPALTATITGFVNGDTSSVVSGKASLSTPAKSASPVGTYPITVGVGTLSAANYDYPNLVGGTLTVTKAHLTVKVDNKAKVRGASNPPLTYALSGFVNGDTLAVVSGSPSLTTTATTSSPAGSYPITPGPGTLAAANYDFPNFVPGTLTVTPDSTLDFDGVGHSVPAVYRPSTAQWFASSSGGGHLLGTFGATNLTDIPVPADYDGIGKTELAVFRPSTAQWFVLGPKGSRLLGTFGATNLADIPVPGDYDGDGKSEMAVFRPATAQWFVMGPKGGYLLGTFGATNLADIPVPGDYDGVGHAEMAVFRPATAQWFVLGPKGSHLLGTFGAKDLADIPVPGDYDAVGHAEMAVFRPSTAQWFVMSPQGGHLAKDAGGLFGAKNLTDIPLEGQAASLKRFGKVGGVKAQSVPAGPLAAARTGSVAGDVSPGRRPLTVPGLGLAPAAATAIHAEGMVVLAPLDPSAIASLFDPSLLGAGRKRSRAAWLTALEQLADEGRWLWGNL